MRRIDRLVQFHDRAIAEPDWRAWPQGREGPDSSTAALGTDTGSDHSSSDDADGNTALWQAIAANHRCNIHLWNEEDQARRPDVPAEHIVASKRRIDQLNQQRNDATEAIDAALLDQLDSHSPLPDARLHSETPGAMIDRLSILSLKIFHMQQQLQRHDVDAVHLARCSEKLQRLRVQRRELAGCLLALLDEVRAGTACFHAYRQFKMYNDPALNPWLMARSPGDAGSPSFPG